jgi:hypothetical protein
MVKQIILNSLVAVAAMSAGANLGVALQLGLKVSQNRIIREFEEL